MGLKDKILSNKTVQRFSHWAQTTSLPGFQKVPVWDVCRLLYYEWMEGNIGVRANSMAFSFFLSLFPALILLVSLVPYIPIANFDTILYNFIFEFLPQSTEEWLGETIKDLSMIQRGNLLSLSFLLMVYFSSNGVMNMMTGFEKSFDTTFKTRNFFEKRFIAIWLTGLLFLFMVSSVIMVISSDFILNYIFTYLIKAQYFRPLITMANWCLTFLIFYSMVAVIYRYAPPFRKKTGYLTPGTTLATVLIIATSLGFAFYVNNFGSYNKIYGSIGAVIVMMVWIELNCFILLIGFEINASIALNRDLGTINDYSALKRNNKRDYLNTK
ncbi:YihY/virulence factor BrkB family protein [Membranihabitans maritimus]|uniref:YihY/virulence factor BrkB family protein n=1 Tax=Membranihabitans maritimus TaxID=2904244 RepID=UPI001F3A00F2|nr:YihY/virulence factor BrkB family protein [Membranihabitans maritimus]